MSLLSNFRYKNALHHKSTEVKFLYVLCFVLILLAFKLDHSIDVASKESLVRIQPGISESKARPGWLAPDVYYYDFAAVMWQKLHHWNNGAEDYPKNVARFSNYFTESCRNQVKDDVRTKSESGELRSRSRTITEMVGYNFDSKDVQLVEPGVWHVNFKATLREYASGSLVKHLDIEYPIRVVDYNIDSNENPWELAIDCFYDTPKVTNNYIN